MNFAFLRSPWYSTVQRSTTPRQSAPGSGTHCFVPLPMLVDGCAKLVADPASSATVRSDRQKTFRVSRIELLYHVRWRERVIPLAGRADFVRACLASGSESKSPANSLPVAEAVLRLCKIRFTASGAMLCLTLPWRVYVPAGATRDR